MCIDAVPFGVERVGGGGGGGGGGILTVRYDKM